MQKESVDPRVLEEWKYHVLSQVKLKIKELRGKWLPSSKKVLEDPTVQTFLTELHKKYVIVPTDKASNNFSIVCKSFYIQCLLKELNILGYKQKEGTYKFVDTLQEDIVKDQISYMQKHKFSLEQSQQLLPFLLWVPKMHKSPSKQRYIADSHCCTTKPLSASIAKCLKLVQHAHSNYCKAIKHTTGFNRMWIVDNSMEVLGIIEDYSKKHIIKDINTWDFSTLYTTLPHNKLKTALEWVITKCFNASSRKFIRIFDKYATWSRTRGKGRAWGKSDLINHINWLVDNIYVICGDKIFRQVIGIPMGTDCAPFLANLFLFYYEFNWLTKKYEEKQYDLLKRFNCCSRYIDDLMSINNYGIMDIVLHEIYPRELSLTSENATSQINYLDLELTIKNGEIVYRLYDKRDAFRFSIVNFPDLSGNIPKKPTYGVFTSQLIRYARCCLFSKDFVERSSKLVQRLLRQNFSVHMLLRTFRKFTLNYHYLVDKYGIT